VVAAALDYSCSRKIHEARRLREGDTPLPGEASRALDDLLEVLQLYGPAREHVKTLYFQ
jgi:hypothetical protein